MSFKEFIIQKVQLFFFLVTMILMAQIILGNKIEPDRVLHYKDFKSTFIMAALCMLPTLVTYSKKELSLKQMLVRQAMQLILIEGLMFVLAVVEIENTHQKVTNVALVCLSTAIIYGLAILIMWYRQYLEAQKLNELLKKIQS